VLLPVRRRERARSHGRRKHVVGAGIVFERRILVRPRNVVGTRIVFRNFVLGQRRHRRIGRRRRLGKSRRFRWRRFRSNQLELVFRRYERIWWIGRIGWIVEHLVEHLVKRIVVDELVILVLVLRRLRMLERLGACKRRKRLPLQHRDRRHQRVLGER